MKLVVLLCIASCVFSMHMSPQPASKRPNSGEMSAISNINADLRMEIIDRLPFEDQLMMARISRDFRQLINTRHAERLIAKNEPVCVFGDLARALDMPIDEIKRSFRYFERVRSREWIQHKLRLRCRNGETPLHIAAQHDHVTFYKVILDSGLISWEVTSSISPFGSRKLFLFKRRSQSFFLSIDYDDVEGILDDLKSEELFTVNILFPTKDGTLTTPLHMAARRNDVVLVVLLISKDALLEVIDFEGTPLHSAVKNVAIDVVSEFFNRDANVDARDAQNETPLHLAIEAGRGDIVRVLLDNKADLSALTRLSRTPLQTTAGRGDITMVSLLLYYGAELNPSPDLFQSPLLMACMKGNVQMVQFLIDAGADPLVQGRQGRS